MSNQTKTRASRAGKKKEVEVPVVPVEDSVVVDTPPTVVETPQTPTVPNTPQVKSNEEVVVEEVVSDEVAKVETDETKVENEEVVDPVEKLQSQFDNLRLLLSDEISNLTESEKEIKKSKVVAFLRKVNRQINLLEKQAFRLVKTKKSNRKNKVVSGFQKPTRISKELAKFTGWNESELRSRVEVTKFICDYIKANNLQNPDDRRQILPDSKLQKLLGYNPKKEPEPLRYYSIQFFLNKMKHFPKEPVEVSK